jgi:hypothetical protein
MDTCHEKLETIAVLREALASLDERSDLVMFPTREVGMERVNIVWRANGCGLS